MATVLDIGVLKGFSDLFAGILIFLIIYGALEASGVIKNRGLNALLAFVITLMMAAAGVRSGVVTAMLPWFTVMAALALFVFVLGGFVGLKPADVLSNFGGKSAVWYLVVPLFIIIVIAWTQGPEPEVKVDPQTGETIVVEPVQQPRPYISVLTNPKVLGLLLILIIATFTVTLMASGGGAVGH